MAVFFKSQVLGAEVTEDAAYGRDSRYSLRVSRFPGEETTTEREAWLVFTLLLPVSPHELFYTYFGCCSAIHHEALTRHGKTLGFQPLKLYTK